MVNDNSKKNWKVMEFCVPIKEAHTDNDEFLISGVAINETTTRNGITYIASELEQAAPSFRNKPILVDHSASINDIVGRTTEKVNFNSTTKAIEFEGRIMDAKIKEMIKDGRITDVSIGAKVSDLVENKEEGTLTAVGMEGLELSLVAVPGDPGAGIANALSESFKIKEMQINGNEIDMTGKEEEGTEDGDDTELNLEKEDNMEEAEKETVETPEEAVEAPTEAPVAEEKLIKVDMTEANKSIAALAEVVGKLAQKVVEQEEAPAPTKEEEIPAAVEDETKGEVGTEETEAPAETEEGFVLEKADTGKGYQIYRDYSKSSGKFNRLCR